MELSNSRSAIIDKMQSKLISIDEFNFEKLSAPPLYSLLSQQDIDRLYSIAKSIRYSGNINAKYKAIDEVMKPRGFVKLSAGTNRVVYKHLEIDTIVAKVAVDDVGIKDNPREFNNQHILKPFVTKVFEVDPSGVVGIFERVIPITSREEFLSIADDVYELINKFFIGEYIMEDIGTKFFMNWAIRIGFGPVLLDFPYCYKLDGNKIYCHAPNNNEEFGICGGVIDYDDGYNNLYCKKCGARYRAKELEKLIDKGLVIEKGINEGRKRKMKVSIKLHGVNVSKAEDDNDIIKEPVTKITKEANVEKGVIAKEGFKVSIKRNVSVPQKQQNKKSSNNSSSLRKNNRGSVTKYEKKESKSSDAFSKEDINKCKMNYSSFDAEHKLMFFKDGNRTFVIDASSIPEDILSVLSGKEDLEFELEKCKKDLHNAEDKLAENDKFIELKNKAFKEKLNEIQILTDDKQELLDKLTAEEEAVNDLNKSIEEYKATIDQLNQKLEEINKCNEEDNQPDHNESDEMSYASLYNDLSDKYQDLEEENVRLVNNVERLTEALDKAEASAMGLQETLQMYSEKNTELEGKILEYNGVINSESIENKMNPALTANVEVEGFNFIDGKLTTLGDMGDYLAIDIPENLKDSKIIVFKNLDDYITDEFGNVIVVGNINGYSLNNVSITTTKINDEE